MTPDELNLLSQLDGLVFRAEILSGITRLAADLANRLQQKPAAEFVREELPLALFGGNLPEGIHSSNVYVIRPLVSSGLERHPNSHQRSMSLAGSGAFELGLSEAMRSHQLAAGSGLPVRDRWVSIPPATWHQAIAGPEPWTVVTFHNALDREIINERL